MIRFLHQNNFRPILLTLSLGLVLVLAPFKSYAIQANANQNIFPFVTTVPSDVIFFNAGLGPHSTSTIASSTNGLTLWYAEICPTAGTTSVATNFVSVGFSFFGVVLPYVQAQQLNNCAYMNSPASATGTASFITNNGTDVNYVLYSAYSKYALNSVTSSLPVTSMTTSTDTILGNTLNLVFVLIAFSFFLTMFYFAYRSAGGLKIFKK